MTSISTVRACLFAMTIIGGSCAAFAHGTPAKVTLCEVLARPAEYSGKTLTMTVRVTATKEGSFLWSPGCKNLQMPLQIEGQAKSNSDIQNLLEMLRLHGLSDHPVIANLTGVFLYNQHDEYHSFPWSFFRVSAATHVRQSDSIERP